MCVQELPPTAKPMNNFQLMRLCLAGMVILSHSPEILDGNRHRELLTSLFHTLSFGEFAVDCFFIVSGYLVYMSWERSANWRSYLAKRILRIYPGFIAASLISALVVGFIGAPSRGYIHQINSLGLVKSLLLLRIPPHPACFAGQPYPSVNGSLWTIEYEFKCYLLVAFIGALHKANRGKTWIAILLSATILNAIQLLFGQSLHYIHLPMSSVTTLLPRFVSLFASGVCFYLFRARIRYSRLLCALSALVLVLCLFGSASAHLAMPYFGAYVVFAIAFAHGPVTRRYARMPDISYGVYLYAWPIQKLLIYQFPNISPWPLFALASVLSICCGACSWYAIEQPFLRMKKRWA